VFGVVVESRRDFTFGELVAVKWAGAMTSTWTTPHALTVIVEHEAAA